MSLRDRLARLEKVAGRKGRPAPLIVVCRRVGDDGEDRAPGVYYANPQSQSPTVVYDGEKPDEKVLAQFRPARGPGPLILTFGPEEVLPPLDLPRED
jgi:hypothetical protein